MTRDTDVGLAEAVRVLLARLKVAERMGWREVTVEVPELKRVLAEAVAGIRADQNRLE